MKRFALAFVMMLGAATAFAGKLRPPDVVSVALADLSDGRDKAIKTLEAALSNDSLAPEEADAVRVHLGEQLRLDGQLDAALKQFQSVADARTDTPWRPAARLGIALLDADKKLGPKVIARLTDASDKEVLATQNADRYAFLARDAATRSDAAAVKENVKRAESFAKDDPEVLARITGVKQGLTGESAPPAKPLTPLERAEAAFDEGKPDEVRRLATEITAAGGEDATVARYLLARLDAVPVDGAKIGLLLPLSGPFAAAGSQIRDALQAGYGDGGRKFIAVDAGETDASAVAALEKLVLKEGVVAVVGPLRTETLDAVAVAANALRVPLISLAQSDAGAPFPWVLQAMVTPGDQVRTLVDHVVTKREFHAFATFAPDNSYGHAAADAFRAELARRQLTLVREVFYDPNAKDVAPFARQLAAKDFEGQAEQLKKLKAEAKAKGKDPSKVTLPPNVSYDALFLPEKAAKIPLACAGLGYEEFAIGAFTPRGPTQATIPLLGLSGWNNDETVKRGGNYVKGALFTDLWHPADSEFNTLYTAIVSRPPTALEAVTYDVGKLLAAVPRDAATRPGFRDAISAAALPSSVTGTDKFADRHASHRVRVLTIDRNTIRPVDTD
jgi:ABC-type branched-subunit amino acid transport system substrate-binding protein